MIYNIIRFVLKYRQAFLVVVAVLAVFGAYQWAKASGRQECKLAQEKAILEAQKQAQLDIRKVQQDYALRKTLLPSQDSGFGVGDVTWSVINGLPDNTRR